MAEFDSAALATSACKLRLLGFFFRQLKTNIITFAALAFASPSLVLAQTQMSIPGSFAVAPTGASTYKKSIQVSRHCRNSAKLGAHV